RPYRALYVVGVADPKHRALVRERTLRDRPAAVERADEVLLRHAHIREEHFVEVAEVGLGQLREGAALDAARRRVDDQRADPLVLRNTRVGTHETQAPIGVLRSRRPNLLTVDDELVADQLGPRLETREVAPGPGLAHAQAPRDLRTQRRAEKARLLLGRPVVVDRRRDDPETLRIRT